MTPHAQLCAEIGKYLRSLERCWYFRPNNQGFGRKGIPDFIVCYRRRMIALEVKAEGDSMTPWQRRELAEIIAAGGIAVEVRSLDQVRYLIEAPANFPIEPR